MAFIKLTVPSGNELFVNTDNIITVGKELDSKTKGRTFITLVDFESYISVMESVDEVMAKLFKIHGGCL